MAEAIGGYFELELGKGSVLYPRAQAFNSARSALQAFLKCAEVRRLFLPDFICPVMIDAARAAGIEVLRYEVDHRLELAGSPSLGSGDYLLYVNYFGLMDGYVLHTLAQQYPGQLIIDNAQALFSPPVLTVPTLYSPRKFVGVPDGGWLLNAPSVSPMPVAADSKGRLGALLGRLGGEPESHYADFIDVEQAIADDGLLGMSAVTSKLLASLDYPALCQRRTDNFQRVGQGLGELNGFAGVADAPVAALCYPLLLDSAQRARQVRAFLLEQRIYVPTYWRELLNDPAAGKAARDLSERLLPLPIDQRYGANDMDRLVSTLYQAVRCS
ncbi:hypothetical protein NVV94_07625 [Pseudomonas sp. LS1212]|uniref:hypothetical protein n=1 Tax=Pseudomonas sp. LS1212 TaxID=2972478 RepID=UPI00215C2F6B|nr:hypothetical protein [Pseudomonas sp. LS1212]UVJ45420.1 hypothetical protein NVV94_07625 [Pseudomonas sp. LS1212]